MFEFVILRSFFKYISNNYPKSSNFTQIKFVLLNFFLIENPDRHPVTLIE